MDAQYARTLVETGLLGLITLGWLARALIASGMRAYRTLHEPEDRGLAVGFVAGTVGLLVHAVGANTFIIIRVMEPFWFFAAVIVVLTTLSAATPATPSAPTPGPVRIRPPFAGVRV
jgi:nitrate/nitrite transporter NarK